MKDIRYLINAYDEKWDEILNDFGQEKLDIYYTKEYCRLYENENSKTYLFVYGEEENIAIYPILITQIKVYGYDTYFDIETPYGYGGPLIRFQDENFIRKFEKDFKQFCIEKNVIAEFIRFHPLLRNSNVFKEDIEVLHNRNTVFIDLRRSEEDLWNDMSSKCRNMVRKAQKSGITIELSSNKNEFIQLYERTMKKVNASSYYFFDEDYYKDLFMNNNIKLFVAKLGDKIIASSVFMEYEEFFHYHFSGSEKEYLKFAPNNLLLWEITKYAKKNGYKYFHLGGGRNSEIDDKLYKFKKGFSSTSCEFYIGKRVHNRKTYHKLINFWEKRMNEKATILLQYRENI